ncbi:MAG: NAD-dependent epimerase/dehydratase family protein [Prevotellaceae bacterium]|jgi:nucleoside-diphosphate-sugar epimerase|nr:NAD-dependent epimerase/dehydratase family protein [Prevotellaceae bacterium]
MNILITGIHGFVGSNLVETLRNDHKLFGLDIVAPERAGVVCTFSWNEIEQIADIDAVIHLAGKAHDTKNKADEKIYFDVNLGLTRKIFYWFLKSTAQKFIFFSSVKAAAESVIGDFLTESVMSAPKGAYGESKLAAENYILSHTAGAKNFSPLQKSVYILRPAMIHGRGNKGNLNLLYNVVKRGVPYPLGAFENRRSFTSIDNISFVVKNLLEKNIVSGIYNISDDETLSTNELIALIASVSGRKCKIWKISPKLMFFAAKIGTVLHLPLNTERLHKLTENYIVSNAKIKSALQIEKMPVSSQNGFELTIKSFENQ